MNLFDLFAYPICVPVVHPFEGRFEKTMSETESRGSKLVESFPEFLKYSRQKLGFE